LAINVVRRNQYTGVAHGLDGKVCRTCHEFKPLDEFYKNNSLNSYKPNCKVCTKEYARRRRNGSPRVAMDDPWHVQQRGYKAAYRARKREATTEPVDYCKVYELDPTCHICKDPVPVPFSIAEFDHVIPLSKGGSHSYSNVRTAHESCNRRKSDSY
jgi:5-methylcytosine-specific restriction endonuclease McrA